ncbi:uncharacterized protein PAC_19755 [Phialocephala subalpina]|uniref:Uncharacterized protein n=1 Tax=Phialocephala subalpina TaxID=576137 RepID=A0A1L7XY44_9HELO|nr:uncharacterized protein PAC_19755 [Phialocephala subalpina]
MLFFYLKPTCVFAFLLAFTPLAILARSSSDGPTARNINSLATRQIIDPENDPDGQIKCNPTWNPQDYQLRVTQTPDFKAVFTVFDYMCRDVGNQVGKVHKHQSVDSQLPWTVEVDWTDNPTWHAAPSGGYAGIPFGRPVSINQYTGGPSTYGQHGDSGYISWMVPFQISR